MTKVFSGIRPSGKLHLGNYLGAIKNWIELQDKADQAIFAVVDLHGITTPYDPKTYHQQVMDVILDYLAAGIDPKKSLLIRQSKIPQHTELAWIFNTITPVGWLERLPNYREKVEQVEGSGDKNAKSYQNNLALLAYPVLMAADILLYKSNLVPVGEDQLLHLNLTNEIGSKFNRVFGEAFPTVKAHLATGLPAQAGARIMSLQDPTKKMSKTGDDGIALSDEPDAIRAKLKKATTDSGKEIKFDEKEKPGISNLLTIYSLLSRKEIKDLEREYASKSYADFKNDLAEVVVEFLKPFQQKRKELEKDMTYVESVLKNSEEQARKLAQKTLDEVKEKMGI
ncbi:MAG: tryptophan--tRNA ligase [bacterium]|nr:tryptophan--tRNA ligase [bacterium]